MSLYRVPTVVVGPDGRPTAGCEMTVTQVDGAAADIHPTAGGGETSTGPLFTDVTGAVPGWVAAGRYVAQVADATTTRIITGAEFRVGPLGPTRPLPLRDGWSDYPGYAPATYCGSGETGVEVIGVLKAADEEGGSAATTVAELPAGCRPTAPVAVPAIIGVVTPAGVETRVDAVVAFPDGRLRAPNQPCRWLALLAPIKG